MILQGSQHFQSKLFAPLHPVPPVRPFHPPPPVENTTSNKKNTTYWADPRNHIITEENTTYKRKTLFIPLQPGRVEILARERKNIL